MLFSLYRELSTSNPTPGWGKPVTHKASGGWGGGGACCPLCGDSEGCSQGKNGERQSLWFPGSCPALPAARARRSGTWASASAGGAYALEVLQCVLPLLLSGPAAASRCTAQPTPSLRKDGCGGGAIRVGGSPGAAAPAVPTPFPRPQEAGL